MKYVNRVLMIGVFLIALLTPFKVNAEEVSQGKYNDIDFYRDGNWLYFINDDGTATVGGYVQQLNESVPKEITIPKTVNGRTVTILNDNLYCKKEVLYENDIIGLTSVGISIVPDGVESIVIPDTVKQLDNSTFWFCGTVKSFTLPESITSIGDCAFQGCTSLESIELPRNLKSIGKQAFSGCTALKRVIFYKGVTKIGNKSVDTFETDSTGDEQIFFQCGDDLMLMIENTDVEKGDNYPGYFFNNLNSSVYAGKVVFFEIGSDEKKKVYVYKNSNEETWAKANGYEVIYYPSYDNDEDTDKPSDTGNTSNQNSNETNGNQSINNADQSKENASKMADKGTEFSVAKQKGKFIVTSSDISNPTVSYIGTTDKKVTSITIPDSVTFNNVTYKVTGISDKAFSGNKKIKKLTIGKNVTTIGKNAFYKCKNLKTIIIKTVELKSVGKNAIKGINSKATIKVPKKQLKVYKKLFGKKTGFKKSIKIKKK